MYGGLATGKNPGCRFGKSALFYPIGGIGGRRLVVLALLGRNPVRLRGPRAQVAHPAALAAERPPAVRGGERRGLAANRARHDPRRLLPAHRLQKASSNGTSCS